MRKSRKLRLFINKNIKYLYILIGLVILYFLIKSIFFPTIKIYSPNKVNIYDKYEYKYKAKYRFKDVSGLVKYKSNVNTNKIGKYYVIYYVKGYEFFKVKKQVIVSDLKSPEIKILNNKYNNIYLCPGEDFKKIKAIAKDNYDKNVDVSINTSGKYIYFKAIDSSGNTTKIKKKLNYIDIEKPVIKLNGVKDNIYINLGESYIEDGAEVTDNCDKKIASKLAISNNINTNKIGKYTVSYKVKDSSGNEVVLSKVVEVVDEDDTGAIYLTFDDGPKVGTTDKILDILKEENVKATFFVIGVGPDELIKRAHDEGHGIAIHSYSHDYKYIYSSEENFYKDLDKIQARMENILSKKVYIYRFPGGGSNTVSRKYNPGIMSRLTKDLREKGYHYFDWNISSGDATFEKVDSSVIYKNVVNNLSKERPNIVLMHDTKEVTRDALRDIIRYAKDNGYKFKTVTMKTKEIHQRVNN